MPQSQGRDALKIEWDDGPHAGYDTEQYHKEMSATAAKPGKIIRDQGDIDGALAGAARTFSAEYYQPHMSHTPMEPPAALANFARRQVGDLGAGRKARGARVRMWRRWSACRSRT